ncbi:MAG: hypothetical protein A2234_10980 [Elusimicrobia bacterium RIFOXYA2_FULL_58_8]|nr:MAG: hypothetical protein A2285_09980 [Elusimicrobia bacterium RIFOXYA12_FULL_57_11]OGS14556.1 MAG: hypothetical protein A2234_10980 [Elusimicrobia bacterium RIFOXYA2_FULL_58_8]
MRWLNDILILGNTPLAYLSAATAFAVTLFLFQTGKIFGISRLKMLAENTATDLDDLAIELLEKFQRPEYVLAAFFVATRYLQLSPFLNAALKLVLLVVFTYRAVTMLQHLLSYWLKKAMAGRELSGEAQDSVMHGTQVVLKALVWVAAGLFILDNLGVNITTLIAGLGIGGVAVALAAQAILGDLFNFFVILLDKPFKTGDFIVFDNISGTIEHVGIKSTRIRSISGELIVVSNSKLLSAGLHNYNQMTTRRVLFKLGLTYQTPPEKMRLATAIIKEAIVSTAATKFDRSHLAAYADFALEFETVYYVTDADYNLYTATHEAILFKIAEGFRAEGIEFAYPTQTLFVEQKAPAKRA